MLLSSFTCVGCTNTAKTLNFRRGCSWCRWGWETPDASFKQRDYGSLHVHKLLLFPQNQSLAAMFPRWRNVRARKMSLEVSGVFISKHYDENQGPTYLFISSGCVTFIFFYCWYYSHYTEWPGKQKKKKLHVDNKLLKLATQLSPFVADFCFTSEALSF